VAKQVKLDGVERQRSKPFVVLDGGYSLMVERRSVKAVETDHNRLVTLYKIARLVYWNEHETLRTFKEGFDSSIGHHFLNFLIGDVA